MGWICRRLLPFLALVVFSIGGAGAQCENPARLRFSLVPQGDAGRDLSAYRPLVAAIEARLGKPVELLLPQSYGGVVEGLVASSIDFAILGPASYLKARGANPEVQVFASYAKRAGPFQEEGPYYRAVLVVPAASRHRSLESLQGGTLALTDPGSTSGAVLPRRVFPALTGRSLDGFFGRIVYVGDHDRAGLAVAAGKVDAAFLSGFHLSELVRQGRIEANSVRVLWRSEPIPQDAIVYRGRLCPSIREGIRAVFLARDGRAFPALLEQQGSLAFVPMEDSAYRILGELQ
ncbi:phosphate/phosphite/phosphonate ABC transporter substrate-binding protein [Azovibrio restrictus]|uniref:phosphate/phosphite/phosphonate ABC transporter substrate-binding protein n=1 Tax=Azovibrio restrictus TaxID=146938 RepID=UPI0026EA82B8|nr:phosphate/phosphite/phosphonate ABC transporter substrate-binding protein [Azovibrio restrictus]MDD3482196.1 phosphate/phosphite/phosphonate ABC transporter substrate-binding protein [Azovibrio restrictus]